MDEITGEWRSCTVRNFIICTHPEISLGRLYKVLVGKLKGKRPLGRDGMMGSEMILGRMAGRVQSGVRWLRIGAGGGLL
jgi:hypothetical protein